MAFQRALTPERERELLVDYEDGWTVHELSIIYKISMRTVYRLLAEHGAKRADDRRRRRKSPKRKKPLELKPCGTNAAYVRHKRNGEYPCTPCLEAHAEDVARFKKNMTKFKRKKAA